MGSCTGIEVEETARVYRELWSNHHGNVNDSAVNVCDSQWRELYLMVSCHAIFLRSSLSCRDAFTYRRVIISARCMSVN